MLLLRRREADGWHAVATEAPPPSSIIDKRDEDTRGRPWPQRDEPRRAARPPSCQTGLARSHARRRVAELVL